MMSPTGLINAVLEKVLRWRYCKRRKTTKTLGFPTETQGCNPHRRDIVNTPFLRKKTKKKLDN